MNHNFRRLSLAILLWSVLVDPAISIEPDKLDRETKESIEQIEKTVAQLRKRPFTQSPKKGIKTKHEIARYLTESFNREMGQFIEHYNTLYKDLFLLPDRADIQEILISLLTDQIGGFYEPTQKTFYLSDSFKGFKDIIIAHELTHALQDCYLPLDILLNLEDLGFKRLTYKSNDDIKLARLSFIEGEAQFVTSLFIAHTGASLAKKMIKEADIKQLALSQFKMSITPAVISNQLMFPYTKGLEFITHYFSKGGWDRINQLYKTLPCSTEQIIHPEKFASGEKPIMVTFPDINRIIKLGWKLRIENSMGEFMCNEIVRSITGGFVKGLRASAGWGGDSFLILTKKKDYLFMWHTVWDTVKDAKEFYTYFTQGITRNMKNKYSGDVRIKITKSEQTAEHGEKKKRSAERTSFTNDGYRLIEIINNRVIYISTSSNNKKELQTAYSICSRAKHRTWENMFSPKKRKGETDERDTEKIGKTKSN